MSPAQRGTGMCESQLLFQPNLVISSSLPCPLSFLSCEDSCFQRWYSPPRPHVVGKKETYQSQRYRTLKRFSNTCWAMVVFPTLSTNHPGQAGFQGTLLGLQGFLDVPLGVNGALTSLDLPVGILRNLLWPESILVLSKREKGSLF